MTFEELALLAQARDAFAEMAANPVDKDAVAASPTQLGAFGRRHAVGAPPLVEIRLADPVPDRLARRLELFPE